MVDVENKVIFMAFSLWKVRLFSMTFLLAAKIIFLYFHWMYKKDGRSLEQIQKSPENSLLNFVFWVTVKIWGLIFLSFNNLPKSRSNKTFDCVTSAFESKILFDLLERLVWKS
jgi:hypothetical protein